MDSGIERVTRSLIFVRLEGYIKRIEGSGQRPRVITSLGRISARLPDSRRIEKKQVLSRSSSGSGAQLLD